VNEEFLQEASTFLSCHVGSIPFKFLSMPVGSHPWLKATWLPVVKSPKKRLASWKSHNYPSKGELHW